MEPLHACTAVTRSYLAHARVLARSVLRHHPDGRLAVLVTDDLDGLLDGSGEPFELLQPSDLPLSRAEFRRMATIYDHKELACALKPWVLRAALGGGIDAAVWLDSDLELFGPIDDLAELGAASEIVLTPHRLEPSTTYVPQYGLFNSGVAAVGQRSSPLLDWWCERLRWNRVGPYKRFWNQIWLDAVPCWFPGHTILRDPAVNVAKWNLEERELVWTESGYEVDGRSLRIFHYSGIHSRPRHRALLDHPAASRLCHEYLERLSADGFEECRRVRYGFGRTAGGLELARPFRRFLRDVFLLAEQRQVHALIDPFEADGAERLAAWLVRPMVRRASSLRGLTTEGRAMRVARRGALRLAGRRWDYERELERAMLEALRELEAVAGTAAEPSFAAVTWASG